LLPNASAGRSTAAAASSRESFDDIEKEKNMTEQEAPYDAIVRAEIAIEILNQARAIVTARVYELEASDPDAAEALRSRRRELIALQQSITVADREAIENVITFWGPRVKGDARFWAEF
jgi:hypothetical protein